jgi:hypothetical protein
MFGACTSGDFDPMTAPAEDTLTERVAVVSLTWRSGEPGLAQAYVVDHAVGERKATLDQLGVPTAGLLLESALGLDPTDGNIASPGLLTDQCRVERASARLSTALLRDAGEILVSTGAVQQVLDFTWLPEGSLGASGAAYSALVPGFPEDVLPGKRSRLSEWTSGRSPEMSMSRAGEHDRIPGAPTSRREPRIVAVAADGSHEVGPFTASTILPEEVHLLTVGGRGVRGGRVPRDEARGAFDLSQQTQGLEVIWARSPRAEASPLAQELTLVVFERVGFGETWTIACASDDDGAFLIPGAALMALPDLGAYQTDRVVVRRVAGASFSARSLPEGLLLVSSEDQAYLE